MLFMRICVATRRYRVVTETLADDSAIAPRAGGHDVSIVTRHRGDLGLSQRRLGHTKVEMTLNIYAHPLPALEQEAAEKLAALIHG
jgi:hypothetical protein